MEMRQNGSKAGNSPVMKAIGLYYARGVGGRAGKAAQARRTEALARDAELSLRALLRARGFTWAHIPKDLLRQR